MALVGFASSSSAMSSNFTFLPPISTPLALRSSIASCTPFLMSMPICACGPVSGDAEPIRTVIASCGAGLTASLFVLGAGASSLPQP
ncbi:hypothetical protein D3C83_96280 [compost metagenome]